MSKYFTATILGCFGLLFWVVTAWMAVQLARIPPFEFLMVAQGVTFLSACVRLSYRKAWNEIKQPISFWIAGVICVPMNILGYFFAFRYIEAALADLIYYMYPIFVLMLGSFSSRYRLSYRGILGTALGFAGVCLLFCRDLSFSPDSLSFKGIGFALLGSFSWAFYTLSTRNHSQAPFEMAGLFFGVGFGFSTLFHLLNETFVMPNAIELFYMLFWGLFVQSLSITLWEKGLRQGNFGLLNGLSYAIPVLSVSLLVATGYVPFSQQLVFATFLVTVGVTLTNQCLQVNEAEDVPIPLD